MFFDEDLCQPIDFCRRSNPKADMIPVSCDEFIDAAIAFPTDVVIDAEILKFLPRPLAK